MNYSEGCSVCGEELVYAESSDQKSCTYCGNECLSNVACPEGHFVCDDCHRSGAIQLIERHCRHSESTDPLEIAVHLMRNPVIRLPSCRPDAG